MLHFSKFDSLTRTSHNFRQTLPEAEVYHELERITQHRDYLQKCLAKYEAGELERAEVVKRLTQHRDYLRAASERVRRVGASRD